MAHRFDVTDYLSIYSTINSDPRTRALPVQDRYLVLIAHGHYHLTDATTKVRGVNQACFQVDDTQPNDEPKFLTAMTAGYARGYNDIDWPLRNRFDEDADVTNYRLRKDLKKTWTKHSATAPATADYVNETYIQSLFIATLSNRVDIMGVRRSRNAINWSGKTVRLSQVFDFLEAMEQSLGGKYYQALLCGVCRERKA